MQGQRQAAASGSDETSLRILGKSALRDLPEATQRALLDLAKVEKWDKRTRIAAQDEPLRSFVLIGSGRIKLERTGSGHAFPLGHRGPGDVVGETALGDGKAHENAIVVDEAEVLAWPLRELGALLERDTTLGAAFAALLLRVERAAEARLQALLLCDVRSRLIGFLLESLERWAEPHPRGIRLGAPFTHADIAQLIGSTRETVTLELGHLRRAGLIDVDRRRFVIPDRDALARHAASSSSDARAERDPSETAGAANDRRPHRGDDRTDTA